MTTAFPHGHLTLGLSLETILEYTGNAAIGILGIIVAFGLAIFIHELGHFLAAKAFKVPVERFVIGFDKEAIGIFPRCIWEKKWGETVYGLSLIPLGGYVKMSGVLSPELEAYLEGEEEKPEEKIEEIEEQKAEKASLQGQALEDMAALYQKPFWQKVIIYSAGVAMNMVLAVLAMGVLYAKGFDESAPYPARVGWISADSPFAGTALQPGDYIVAIEGTPVKNEVEVDQALSEIAGGKKLGEDLERLDATITLERENASAGEDSTYTYDLTLTDDPELQQAFGTVFFRRDAYIDFVYPDSPADDAGFERGDEVISINGEDVEDWSHFTHIIRQSANEELNVVVKREEDGENARKELAVTPWEDADDPDVGQVGVVVGNPNKTFRQEGVVQAFGNAPERVYTTTSNYLSRLGALFGKLTEGNVTAVSRELGGPVGIGRIAYKMAQSGLSDWINFLIMLNVALAVMNILPIPVLDGGHIVFAIYEALFRQPVPARILVPILNSAVVFILILVVLITFNDFRKIIF